MSHAAGSPSMWSTLRDAVRGTEHDLTSIPLSRAVILLAVPTLLEMSMESLFAIADIFYVSKLGSDAVATVGLTEALLSVVYSLSLGVATAATAMIARRFGEKDREEAGTAAGQAILLGLVLSVAHGVVGAVFAKQLLDVMGAERDVVTVGWRYTAIMLGGSLTIFMLYVNNAIFRGTGAAAIAMRTLWLSNGINIVLAPFLVFGIGFPRLGVTGAAIATTASRAIGVAYQLAMLARGRARMTIARRHLRLQSTVMRELARLATSASLQSLIETASWLGLVRILSSYGSEALAGYSIAMRVVIFALMPSWGISMAAATLVGQNLGANEPGRAELATRTIGRYNVAFLGAITAVFLVLADPIVRLFTPEEAVARYAAEALRIVSLGFVLYAYGMVCLQAFNGAGDTKTPMLVNLGSFWFFKIPLAYVLAKGLGIGPRGVFVAVALAYSAQAAVAYVLFRRGKWKETKIA